MWSRRKFIFSILTSCALWSGYGNNTAFALSKRGHSDPRLLTAEYWPPAISCSFLDVFGDNLCCMVDDLGRLATADILQAAQHSHSYPVMGEVNNLGNKILFFKTINGQSALVITAKQIDKSVPNKDKHNKQADQQDNQFICHLINLENPQAPHIVSSTILPSYSQMNAFALGSFKNKPLLCVSGSDRHGENRVAFLGLKGRGKFQVLSAFKIKDAAKNLLLGSETLLIIHNTPQASIFAVNNLVNPQLLKSVKVTEEIGFVTNYDEVCAWSSQQDGKQIINTSNLRSFPQPANRAAGNGLLCVEALTMNGKYVLALGSNGETSLVVPFSIDKNHALRQQESVKLVGFVENISTPSRIALGKDVAFVSSGWAGVQVLTANHKGVWTSTTCYSLQRLPISGMASWSNYLLLAGAELQLYDMSQPKHPKLLSTTKLPSTIKTIISAGSYVLCLDKSGIMLRKMENPESVIVKLAISAQHLSYDPGNHKAYLLQADKEQKNTKDTKVDKEAKEVKDTKDDKKSKEIKGTKDNKDSKAESMKLVQVSVYKNSIEIAKTFSVLGGSYCSSADEGHVLVGNLDSLAIYKPDEENELICQREFKNLAWREILFSKGNIFATAIDENVNGFFLTMSFDGQSINLLSTTKLPHDGMSLTVSGDVAYTVGQNNDGNSLLTSIDISNNSKPKILNSKPAVQSAAVVSANNNLAIVSGQGFEVFSI